MKHSTFHILTTLCELHTLEQEVGFPVQQQQDDDSTLCIMSPTSRLRPTSSNIQGGNSLASK